MCSGSKLKGEANQLICDTCSLVIVALVRQRYQEQQE